MSVATTDVDGLRVTVQNNSTSVALASTDTVFHVGTEVALDLSTRASLASGTNMVGNKSYVAAFTDVDTAVTTVTEGSTTNRTHWL